MADPTKVFSPHDFGPLTVDVVAQYFEVNIKIYMNLFIVYYFIMYTYKLGFNPNHSKQ